MRNTDPGQGTLLTAVNTGSAGCNTEGGLVSLLKGLGLSCSPCAKVLSVAGFFAINAPFPGPGGFILVGKEALFLPTGPRTGQHC